MDLADSKPPTERPEPRRGGCLTAFLILMIVANSGVALTYFFLPATIQPATPQLTGPLAVALGLAALLNVALVIAVWNWRRVGVYGLIAVSLMAFPFNLWLGIPLVSASASLVGPVILALLVRARWEHFA